MSCFAWDVVFILKLELCFSPGLFSLLFKSVLVVVVVVEVVVVVVVVVAIVAPALREYSTSIRRDEEDEANFLHFVVAAYIFCAVKSLGMALFAFRSREA